jgi:hypothetical protein
MQNISKTRQQFSHNTASAKGPSEAPLSTVQVLLNIHLWSREGADAPPLAFAMVGDLLSASSCEVRDALCSSITPLNGFTDPLDFSCNEASTQPSQMTGSVTCSPLISKFLQETYTKGNGLTGLGIVVTAGTSIGPYTITTMAQDTAALAWPPGQPGQSSQPRSVSTTLQLIVVNNGDLSTDASSAGFTSGVASTQTPTASFQLAPGDVLSNFTFTCALYAGETLAGATVPATPIAGTGLSCGKSR